MTETTALTSHEATVDRYLRFWNAATPDEQRRLAAETLAEDIEYRAPIGLLEGTQALIDFRDQVTGHLGSLSFHRRGDVQVHHDRARLPWRIEARGEETFAAGIDVLTFGPDGRIRSVVAFLDKAPEGFDPHAHE
ncbi:MAG TPA: nuclear transport factor 2 family protein [Streptosporangiales bacterium]